MPAFDYTGTGIKIGAIVQDSPAEKAGLKIGDIIIALDGEKTNDLKAYSDLLKTYSPGDVVKITILRDNIKKTVSVTLEER